MLSHKEAAVKLGCSAPTLRKYLRQVGYQPTTMVVRTPRGNRYAQGIPDDVLDRVEARLRGSEGQPTVAELKRRIERLEAKLDQKPQPVAQPKLLSVSEMAQRLGLNPYSRNNRSMGRAMSQRYRERYCIDPTFRPHGDGGSYVYDFSDPAIVEMFQAVVAEHR